MHINNPIDTAIFDILTIAPVNPAAGASLSIAVNLNARWQLISVEFVLVTDANAADRLITIEGDDGTDEFYGSAPTGPQTASQNIRYRGNTGIGQPFQMGTAGRIGFPLNTNFFLNTGDTLDILIGGIQVADQISDIVFRVKQWIVEN